MNINSFGSSDSKDGSNTNNSKNVGTKKDILMLKYSLTYSDELKYQGIKM